MAVEVEELYSNLNKLLLDICKFLTSETNYESLTLQARKEADALINRSKSQLQELAKVALTGEYDGAYVDMEPKPVYEHNEEVNIYSTVENTTILPYTAQNPYENLPAKELHQDVKYGALQLKYKLILNFEKSRRVYGGIHDKWFILYYSEKDSKPFLSLNLKFYKAQEIPSKSKKCIPNRDFEVVNKSKGEKSYSFQALTHKDMLQWITFINNPSKLQIQDFNDDDVDDNNYVEIDSYMQQSAIAENKPPDLPARRIINDPIEQKPTRSISSDDSNTDYDPIEPIGKSTSSFSSGNGDEEEIYPPFVPRVENAPKVQSNTEEDEQIYENGPSLVVEKPKIPTKPKIFERALQISLRRK